MRSLLEQLQNNESVLLMYLAGELPPEDHAEVEQLLATDGGMRRELVKLREAHVGVIDALAAMDRAEPAPIAPAVASRQASRLIVDWNVRRLAAPKPAPAAKGLPYPWWVYPVATAASILLAFLVWWGNHPDGGPPSGPWNESAPIIGNTGTIAGNNGPPNPAGDGSGSVANNNNGPAAAPAGNAPDGSAPALAPGDTSPGGDSPSASASAPAAPDAALADGSMPGSNPQDGSVAGVAGPASGLATGLQTGSASLPTPAPSDIPAVDPVAAAQDDGNRDLAIAEAQFRSSALGGDGDSLLGAQ